MIVLVFLDLECAATSHQTHVALVLFVLRCQCLLYRIELDHACQHGCILLDRAAHLNSVCSKRVEILTHFQHLLIQTNVLLLLLTDVLLYIIRELVQEGIDFSHRLLGADFYPCHSFIQ